MNPARTRFTDEVTILFARPGEPDVRLVVPADKALLRALVLLLGHRDLRPGDALRVEASDDGGFDEH